MLIVVGVLMTVAVARTSTDETGSGSAGTYEGCIAANLLPPEECAAIYGPP